MVHGQENAEQPDFLQRNHAISVFWPLVRVLHAALHRKKCPLQLRENELT